MRQPDLCDGCFQPLPDEMAGTIGIDVYPEIDDDYDPDDPDDNPINDEDYVYRVHSWACLLLKAGREALELPSRLTPPD